jgi:hypothetical protein
MVEEQLLASVKMNVFFPSDSVPSPVTLEALKNAKSRKVAYQVRKISLRRLFSFDGFL